MKIKFQEFVFFIQGSQLRLIKKHLKLLLLIFSPFMSFAQKNFQPGLIVNLNGDTTSGYIDYKEWNISPSAILFKPSEKSVDSKELTVNDIRYFEIYNKEAYYRFAVKISMDPTDLNSIGLIDTTSTTDVVFLKLIQKGEEGSLFGYSDKLKQRFYILQKNESQPKELVLKRYYSSDDNNLQHLVTDESYKNQLKQFIYSGNLLSDQLSKKIDEANYNETDFKKIFLNLNKIDVTNQGAVQRPSKLRWFAGGGLQRGKISVEGDNVFAKYTNENNSSWLPRISGGFDLFANPHIGKLLFRMEAGVQMNKSTSTASWNTDKKVIYNISYSSISLATQVLYNIYNKEQIKVPVGIGFVYNLASYTKNEYKEVYASGQEGNKKENYFDLITSYPGYQAKIGMVLNNKLEFSFLYQRTASLTKYIFYSLENRNMQLQINYLFKRKIVSNNGKK